MGNNPLRIRHLACARDCFNSRRACTNQSSLHSSGPPALPTLLQYYCMPIWQYTARQPTPLVYAIDYTMMAISCKAQSVTGWPLRAMLHIYLCRDGLYTKGTRAHTHRELIREWLWESKGNPSMAMPHMYQYTETKKQSPHTGARANNTLHKYEYRFTCARFARPCSRFSRLQDSRERIRSGSITG